MSRCESELARRQDAGRRARGKRLSYAELRDKPIWEMTDEEFEYVLRALLREARPVKQL